MKSGVVEDHGHAYKFYLDHYFYLKKTFKYGEDAKFWGYIDTNAKPTPCIIL
jgi:hypothetical protein